MSSTIEHLVATDSLAELELENVELCSPVTSEMTVKLAGTGYARRISDLHRSNPFLRDHEDSIPDSWSVDLVFGIGGSSSVQAIP